MVRMTYEEKAGIYLRALEQTGSVALALQAADRAMFSTRRKLDPAQVAELRRRRAEGAKLSELAADFGIVENYACILCRGVRKPPAPARTLSPLGLQIVRVVGEQLFGLPPGWERVHRRGARSGRLGLAQRAATLAMRGHGLTNQETGDVLNRDPSTVIKNLVFAREDVEARQLAALVTEILAREAAPIAVPEPLPAPSSAAA